MNRTAGAAADAAIALLVAGLYAVGAVVTLSWFDSSGLGPAFFPSAGVTLAALASTRARRWPWLLAAVFAAELVIDLTHDQSPAQAVGYALANTVEPLTGAALLRAAVGRVDLGRRRDLWLFLLLGCLAGPAVGATVAATGYTLTGGDRPWLVFGSRWLVGDGLGVLLVGGAVLGWRSGDEAVRRRLHRPGGLALVGVSMLAALAVFRWDVVWLGYVLAALLVCVAFALGTRGVGLAGLVMAVILGEASATGRVRVPAGISPDTAWFTVNLVIALVVVVCFALAVEIAERESSVRRVREAEEARRVAEAAAATATERSLLLDAEQRARARAELLQDVTERLSGLTTRADVVRTVADLTATALVSRTSIVALPEPDGRLRAAAWHGYGEAERAVLDGLLAAGAAVPLTTAFSRNEFVAASGAAEVRERFPDAGELPVSFGAVAAAPCVVDGRAIGAVGWGFTAERDFDDDFAAVAVAIGAQTGLALERGRLFEAERRHTAQLAALQSAVAEMAAANGIDAVVAAVLGSGLSAVGATSAAIRVLDADGRFATLAATGLAQAALAGLASTSVTQDVSPMAEALRTGTVVVLRTEQETRDRYPILADALERTGEVAVAAAPFSSTTVEGGLYLAFDTRQVFDAEQVALLATFAQTAGQALARAESAEREHGVAVQLQQALLGRPDEVDGLDVATEYRPAVHELHVGGDWYDVVRLPGGRAALVVGDVSGHSLAAAAAMGQIRSTLRALAPVVEDPAALLERLDASVERIDGAPLTSLWYGVLDPASGELVSSCAGHPPPLLVPSDGEPRWLDGGHGPLLGLPGARTVERVVVGRGDLLVLYTDGLVERRGESLTVGLERLRTLVADAVRTEVGVGVGSAAGEVSGGGRGPAAVRDRLTGALLPPDAADDTALLVARRA